LAASSSDGSAGFLYVTGALDIVPGALFDESSRLAYNDNPDRDGAGASLAMLKGLEAADCVVVTK